MKKSTSVIMIITFIICSIFIGITCYYLGSKIPNSRVINETTNEVLEVSDDTDLREEIRNELREELKDEIRQELYNEVYAEVNSKIEENLKNKIEELQAEEDRQNEELDKQKQSNAKPTTTSQSNNTNPAPVSKSQPYIKVHDVSASASGGTEAIAAALRSAVDGSSGVATGDADAITGIGTFPIYWTSSDGATATSYITITE